MKSLILKSVYAGLGLLGSGKETVEHLGRELAKKADLSEKDGEKIARRLRARSDKAIHTLEKTLRAEVASVVDTLRDATTADVHGMSSRKRKAKPTRRAAGKRRA